MCVLTENIKSIAENGTVISAVDYIIVMTRLSEC